ncbi:hypothetical protein AAMO2058_000722100 [Amorphochlora amoebiformis]
MILISEELFPGSEVSTTDNASRVWRLTPPPLLPGVPFLSSLRSHLLEWSMFKAYPQRKPNRARKSRSEGGKHKASTDMMNSKPKKKEPTKLPKSTSRKPSFLRNISAPILARSLSISGKRVSTPPPNMIPTHGSGRTANRIVTPHAYRDVKVSNFGFRGELSASRGSFQTMRNRSKIRFQKVKRTGMKGLPKSSSSTTQQQGIEGEVRKRKSSTQYSKQVVEGPPLKLDSPPLDTKEACVPQAESLRGVSKIEFSGGSQYVRLLQNRQVDLSGKHLSDTVGRAILGSLATSPATEVFLHCNQLSTQSAMEIMTSLKLSPKLRILVLSHNNIGDEGAKYIATGLRGNRFLECLSVDSNHIGDRGAIALAEALQDNKTLKTLDIDSNGIGDKGAGAISAAVKTRCNLRELSMNDNKINAGGIAALGSAMKQNLTITKLCLFGNPGLNRNVGEELKVYTKRNKRALKKQKRSSKPRKSQVSGLRILGAGKL